MEEAVGPESIRRSNPGKQSPATLVNFQVRILGLEPFAMYRLQQLGVALRVGKFLEPQSRNFPHPLTPPNLRVGVPDGDEQINIQMRTTPHSSNQ